MLSISLFLPVALGLPWLCYAAIPDGLSEEVNCGLQCLNEMGCRSLTFSQMDGCNTFNYSDDSLNNTHVVYHLKFNASKSMKLASCNSFIGLSGNPPSAENRGVIKMEDRWTFKSSHDHCRNVIVAPPGLVIDVSLNFSCGDTRCKNTIERLTIYTRTAEKIELQTVTTLNFSQASTSKSCVLQLPRKYNILIADLKTGRYSTASLELSYSWRNKSDNDVTEKTSNATTCEKEDVDVPDMRSTTTLITSSPLDTHPSTSSPTHSTDIVTTHDRLMTSTLLHTQTTYSTVPSNTVPSLSSSKAPGTSKPTYSTSIKFSNAKGTISSKRVTSSTSQLTSSQPEPTNVHSIPTSTQSSTRTQLSSRASSLATPHFTASTTYKPKSGTSSIKHSEIPSSDSTDTSKPSPRTNAMYNTTLSPSTPSIMDRRNSTTVSSTATSRIDSNQRQKRQPPEKKKSKDLGLGIGLSVAGVVLCVLLVVGAVIIRRKYLGVQRVQPI